MSGGFVRTITHEEAEWQLLRLANDKGKFALSLGPIDYADLQLAFERGINREWFTLVDLSPVSIVPHAGLMRVFRLTQAGRRRRTELEAMFTEAKAE